MTLNTRSSLKAGMETDRESGNTAALLSHTPRTISRRLMFLFATTCALSVANVYFAQPLLDSMSASLSVGTGVIGIVVTATQIGYALGLLFVVPLGDMLNRRTLILTQMLISAVALCAVGLSQNWGMLLSAMMLVGLTAVVVQVVVAYTASLTSPEQRGQAVGTVTSGVILGILLARFVSGAMADLAGWRGVYFVSAALMVGMSLLLYRAMPTSQVSQEKGNYWQLLGSVFTLYRTERTLRVRGTFALLIFAAFSVLWTAMVLPLSSAQRLTRSHTRRSAYSAWPG